MFPHRLKIPNIEELKTKLEESIIGQPELIDSVIYVVFRHLYKVIGTFTGQLNHANSNLLVIGRSGTGKTYTIRKISNLLKIPFIEINGPSINQEGWHGESLIGLIAKSMRKFQHEESRAYPIIYIDEFDKLCAPQGSSNTLNHSVFIQASILKYIEGAKVKINEVEYDTSMFCFIFSGAFGDMGNTRVNTIGFNSTSHDITAYQEKLRNYGVLDELIGRITRIVRTNDFNAEMYRDLICNKHSYFNEWFNFFKSVGGERKREPNWTLLIDEAVKLNLGARGLNNLMEAEIDEIMKSIDLQSIWDMFLGSGPLVNKSQQSQNKEV